jgi:hypothetical protein
MLKRRYKESFEHYTSANNHPTIFLYDAIALYNEENTLRKTRKIFLEKLGTEPFIIGDVILKIPSVPKDSEWYLKYKNFFVYDAITGWAGVHNRFKEEYVKKYEELYNKQLSEWFRFAKEKGLYFVPTVIPGFDNSYSWGTPGLSPIERSPQKFMKRLEIASKYFDDLKMMRIDTWNDFGEWSYIEPSTETNFMYLMVLRKFLEKD